MILTVVEILGGLVLLHELVARAYGEIREIVLRHGLAKGRGV
jgi:hypothetical protein